MNRHMSAVAVALMLGLTALTACSSDKSASSSTTPAAGATTPAGGTPAGGTAAPTGSVLTIKDFAFGAISVKAGEAFTIVNADSANHTVTADDGSFLVKAHAGSTSRLVIPTPGTYKIHCDIHSAMTGTIIVS